MKQKTLAAKRYSNLSIKEKAEVRMLGKLYHKKKDYGILDQAIWLVHRGKH